MNRSTLLLLVTGALLAVATYSVASLLITNWGFVTTTVVWTIIITELAAVLLILLGSNDSETRASGAFVGVGIGGLFLVAVVALVAGSILAALGLQEQFGGVLLAVILIVFVILVILLAAMSTVEVSDQRRHQQSSQSKANIAPFQAAMAYAIQSIRDGVTSGTIQSEYAETVERKLIRLQTKLQMMPTLRSKAMAAHLAGELGEAIDRTLPVLESGFNHPASAHLLEECIPDIDHIERLLVQAEGV